MPLFDDEAYYALWARDLALGYYDHPPVIAYMIRMGTGLLGETTLGIRLFAVIGFVASGYLVGDMARCMSGGAVGLPVLATTLYNLGLLVFALGSFATPDAPSTLFWVAALWAAVRAAEQRGAAVCANGFSCREQIRQTTGRSTLHLAEVLDSGDEP